MAQRDFHLYLAASATSLTLLAVIAAGTSLSPGALLLAAAALVTPIVMSRRLDAPALAPARPGRRS